MQGRLFCMVTGKQKGFYMIVLNGKYKTAKVFTEVIEQESISQIIELCNQKVSEGSKIRIMPDVHAGSGCTIGTTMTITDKVIPNLVGVDIGCGMETVKIKEKHIELQQLDKLIYRTIPSGFAIRKKIHRYINNINLAELYCSEHVNIERAELSLGTLGGGNHFIEVDKGSDDSIYIVIHSGSRHLGVETAKYYQKQAYNNLNKNSQTDIDELVSKLKAEGKSKQIESEIKKLKNTKTTNIPKHLAYTEGLLFEQYIHDMKITQEYAYWNREAIANTIIKGMHLHEIDRFQTIHNYIDTKNMILRKGAISCQLGEKVIIPINMRDGSLICVGKGNPDWNFSGPHGAGRLFSRSEAKRNFTVSEFKKTMKEANIYSTSVNESTLDESPMAYKPMDEIIQNIQETADVIEIIKPVYSFKASTNEVLQKK